MRLAGRGLHSGRECAVTIERRDGPTTIERTPLSELRVDGRDHCSVAVVNGREILVIEHLLSAIVGTGAFHNIAIEIEGDEVPLLDGGSAELFDAIVTHGRPRKGAVAKITRQATYEAHNTTLIVEPHDQTDITIEVDYPAARFGRALIGTARWNGDADRYRSSIATARTFGASHELAQLRARGLAAHIAPGSVVALDRTDEWAPSDPHEPIRHKLLDVLGDLAPLGGRILGRIRVITPSHRGTRAALALARDVFTQPGDAAGR